MEPRGIMPEKLVDMTLKEYFGSEARKMTPWFAKHTEIIQSLVENPNLKFYRREKQVDSFFIDIMLNEGSDVYIVENQFGQGDHDHFGKCITYAKLTNAKKVIWIADEFLIEHRKVIQKIETDIVLVEVQIQSTENKDFAKMHMSVFSKEGSKHLYFEVRPEGVFEMY